MRKLLLTHYRVKLTGTWFEQKIRNVPAGTSWAGSLVRELSVLVGTFVLVRDGFSGEGRDHEQQDSYRIRRGTGSLYG